MRRSLKIFIPIAALAATCAIYIHTHPLVFNESFWGHAHCIAVGGLSFRSYATDHHGKFPYHTNGYGDALLLMTNEIGEAWFCVNGPGYDDEPFLRALATGSHLDEKDCGRVYVQGLSDSDNPEIALLFDKLPTPGGDHCHFLRRLRAPLVREVAMVDGSHKTVRESDWPEFSRKQIELLVAAGIPPKEAEKLYATDGK
jgi:hypothetical protein